eukprot:COSAG05_NODE_4435_length_1517_cov_2.189704_1_plen_87_part_10
MVWGARLIKQLEKIVRKLDVLEEARKGIPQGSTWRVKEDGEGGTAMTPLDEFGRPLMQLSVAAAEKQSCLCHSGASALLRAAVQHPA